MCELFGMTSATKVCANDYLAAFFSHSKDHPHGWGIGRFYDGGVNVEKEPIQASESVYLKHRMEDPIETTTLFAHIRNASIGCLAYENCHPFVKRDDSGRAWTLIHNGTIFSTEMTAKYEAVQNGSTDSERILCLIVEEMNRKNCASKEERFALVNDLLCRLSEGNNKVNLMLFDGELFYVHTNLKETLYYLDKNETVYFSTTPLTEEAWRPVSFMQPLAYENGVLCFEGTKHENEYILGDSNEQTFEI